MPKDRGTVLPSPCHLAVVPPTRLERVAYGLGNRRSILLSYGGSGRAIMCCPTELVKSLIIQYEIARIPVREQLSSSRRYDPRVHLHDPSVFQH